MTNLLVDWIQDRLGIILEDNHETLSEQTRNGHLIAKILLNYMVINQEQANLILESDINDNDTIELNFRNYIKHWLGTINIHLTNLEITSMVYGANYDSIHLLYQLYLELKSSSCTKILLDKKLNEKSRPQHPAFNVATVPESSIEEFQLHNHPSEGAIRQNYDIIHWHKDRLKILKQKCREARENYSEFLNKQCHNLPVQISINYDDISEHSVCVEVESLHEDYCELMRQAKASKSLQPLTPNKEKAKAVLKKYQRREQEKVEKDEIKKRLEEELMFRVLKELDDQSGDQFNHVINKKLLEQSLYEKKMVQTLLDVKMQRETILRNKQIIEDLLEQKKTQNFIDNFLMMKKDEGEKKLEYYIEKERLLNLHNRIYAERERLNKERVYKMCLDAVEDMVDVALRTVGYKEEFDIEPPRRTVDQWKALFFKQQSLFDFVEPISRICRQDEEELEEIQMEIQRQDAMDDVEFERYQKFEFPFQKEMISIGDEDTMYNLACGMNCVGNIVHRILESKYPKPVPIKPNIENMKIAACVDGLPDTSCLPLLGKLLSERRIKVVQLPDAINYCMAAFKRETTREYPDTILIQETEKVVGAKKKDKKSKGKKQDKKDKKEKKSKAKSIETSETEPEKPKFVDEINQTPIIFPGQEIQLSPAAQLGELADQQLNIGARLTDDLMLRMLIIYLESMPDAHGFALFNYPQNFAQAALLEEYLTGIPVPGTEMKNELKFTRSIKDLGDFQERVDEIPPDPREKFRHSRLVPNPEIIQFNPIYDSFLTAYIKMKHVVPNEETGEFDIPPPYEPMGDDADPIDIFYAELGCNYSMYYQNFGLDTLKYLGKLIIGEYTLPPKTSIELFGDTVKYVEAEYVEGKGEKKGKLGKKGDKKKKPKDKKKKEAKVDDKKSRKSGKDKSSKSNEKKSAKKKKKGGPDTVVIVHEDKATQMPEYVEEEEEPLDEKPAPKIGDPGWDFVNLGVPQELGSCLATIWENMEQVYIEDLKQVFFINRIYQDAFVPYTQYIKEHMGVLITKPDNKQQFVSEFQRVYNEFDQDFRVDDEFKAEMFSRIKELKDQLYSICEENMLVSERERQRMIGANWVPRQLVEICNNYINCFQLEIDRSVDTLQIINDYYTAMVTSMPTETTLNKSLLPKLSKARDLDDNQFINNQFMETLTNIDSELEQTVFHEMIDEKISMAQEILMDVRKTAQSTMEKTKSVFKPKKTGKSKSPTKAMGLKKGDKINVLTIYEPRQAVIDKYDVIVNEWETALMGENLRADIRLNILRNVLLSNVEGFVSMSRNTFYTVFYEVESRYKRECLAVDTLCKILSRAVEEEIAIQEELILDGEEFCVDPLHKLFPDPIIIPEPIKEEEFQNICSVGQLERLTSILYDIAPSGYIVERSFLYILQDLISREVEDDKPLVPKLWKQLMPCDLQKFSRIIFDTNEYVAWKEFVLFNLMVGVPSMEELMALWHEFRGYDPDRNEYITDYQYNTIKYWYERDSESSLLRSRLRKELIFKLYRLKGDLFNYTAFLLDLCKDEKSIVGFCKVLSVCLGRFVCCDKKIGEAFVSIVLQRLLEHEQSVANRDLEIADNIDMATDVIDDIIDDTVHQCDSVIIQDYYSETSKSNLDLNFVPESALPMQEEIERYIKRAIDEDLAHEEEDNERNIPIGFEDRGVPNLAYFLPFDVLIMAITMSLPWHSKVQNIEDQSFREKMEAIFEKCRNKQFNNKVLCHEFLNHPDLLDLINPIRKFIYQNPVEIIEDLIKNE